MSYQVLARKYRPQKFSDVIGQEHVTRTLQNAIEQERIAHGYIFSGHRGIGKTTVARILAMALNCRSSAKPSAEPCGVCESCTEIRAGNAVDVIEIDAATNRGIDEIRELRDAARYRPARDRFKIYIIDEAHMVTREGFNALLKLVEEPPPHLKFVFATTEPEKVIATIRSRTHHYPFRLVPPAVLREHLEQILAAEQVPYEPPVLPIVVRAGAGSVRDALSVLDQLIAGSDSGGLRYDRAVALLGYTDDRLLDEVVGAFSAGDGAAVFHAIDHVVEAGHDTRRFAADLLDRLRDLIVLSAVPDAASTGLIEAPADRLEQMSAQAAAFGQVGLTRAAEIVSAGLLEMRGATSPRLLLELMCAQVLLSAGTDNAGLAERLDRLERRLSSAPQSPAPRPDATRAAQRPEPRQAAEATEPARAARPSVARPARPVGPASAAPPEPPHVASSAQAASEVPAATASLADADAIRARWPDILAAVQGKRRVAWMLLSNASVESYADGVLTVAFAKPGDAKGFVTSGSDKDLAQVLSSMYGITVHISTTAATASASRPDIEPGTAPSSSQPSRQDAHQDERRGVRPGGDGASQARAASRPQQAAASRQRDQLAGRPLAPAAGSDPEPSDLPAPDILTGTDLIERELGGRIIQDLDGS